MKFKIKRILALLIVIIWLIVIFAFSSMTGNDSNSKSKVTINKALTKTAVITNKLDITNVNVNSNKKYPIIKKLNQPLRKCMHASVYFVLSIIICIGLRIYEVDNKKAIIITILVAFIYACTDEYHQTFVKGRTGCFTDVLIDTCGAFLGVMIFNLIMKLFNKIKRKN